MRKWSLRLWLITVIIILTMLSLMMTGCLGIERRSGVDLKATQSAYITATYGAEEYHLQLTALATPIP